MANKKKNLPVAREVNIFTSEKNVNNVIVAEIIESVRIAKKIKIKNADGFHVGIFKEYRNLNVDTVMYLIEHYNFDKHTVETNYDNKIYITSRIEPKDNIRINIASEKWKINLLPNEAKNIIYANSK